MSILFQDKLEPLGDFPLLQDSHFEGGLRSVIWDTASFTDALDAINSLVPANFRKEGMIVRATQVLDANNLPSAIVDTKEYFWTGFDWEKYLPVNVNPQVSYGVVSGCLVTVNSINLTATVQSGTLVDKQGRRIVFSSNQSVTVTSSTVGQVFAIVWDPTANSGEGGLTAKVLSATGGAAHNDLPLGLVKVSLPVVTYLLADVVDIRRWDNGDTARQHVSVGPTVGSSAGANFSSLRSALLHINSFSNPAGAESDLRPKLINIVGSYTEPFVVADEACIKVDSTGADQYWVDCGNRLDSVRIVGLSGGGSGSVPTPQITWGHAATIGSFLRAERTGATRVSRLHVENISFMYDGIAGNSSKSAVFRNLDGGFSAKSVRMEEHASGALYCLASWDIETDFSALGVEPTRFDQVDVSSDNFVRAVLHFDVDTPDTVTGDLVIQNSSFSPLSDALYLVEGFGSSNLGTARISVENCRLGHVLTAVVRNPSTSLVVLTNCHIGVNDGSTQYALASGVTTNPLMLVSCTFDAGQVSLAGAKMVTSCQAKNGSVVTVSSANYLVNCSLPGMLGTPALNINAADGSIYGASVTSAGAIVAATTITAGGYVSGQGGSFTQTINTAGSSSSTSLVPGTTQAARLVTQNSSTAANTLAGLWMMNGDGGDGAVDGFSMTSKRLANGDKNVSLNLHRLIDNGASSEEIVKIGSDNGLELIEANSPSSTTSITNKLFAANTVKAWGRIAVSPGGTITIEDGFNLGAPPTFASGAMRVTLAGDLSAGYAVNVMFNNQTSSFRPMAIEVFNRNPGSFDIFVYDRTGVFRDLDVDFSTAYYIDFIVIGRQA